MSLPQHIIDATNADLDRIEAGGSRDLAEFRKSLGVTQVELADATGLSQESISRVERAANPTVATVTRYLEGLGAKLQVTAVVDGQTVPLRFPEAP